MGGGGVFVETGSYTGGGIATALDAGFKRVLSIEIQPSYHQMCKKKFNERKEVELILGDSALKLGEVIKGIDEPITFWLDGQPLEEQTIVHQLEASPEKFGVPTVSARNRSCEPLGLLPTLTNKGNFYVS